MVLCGKFELNSLLKHDVSLLNLQDMATKFECYMEWHEVHNTRKKRLEMWLEIMKLFSLEPTFQNVFKEKKTCVDQNGMVCIWHIVEVVIWALGTSSNG